MVSIVCFFLLFSQTGGLFIKSGNVQFLKDFFKYIPVEIQSDTLKIPQGVYGPEQGYLIISEKKFQISDFEEVPLPNIPGKFKLYILNCKKGDKNFKVLFLIKYFKKKWVVQSFKEIPG